MANSFDVENVFGVSSAKRENSEVSVLEPPLVSWCTRKSGSNDNPCVWRREAVGVRHLFTAEALRSFATREQSLALHSSHRSRLGACGNLATTASRPVAAVGTCHRNFRRSTTFPYFRASVPTNKIGVFEWNYDSTSGLEWT
ncbi:hypothetical protein TNIN_53821 [Trichonephila inaurata madagascariensis]|uniref:Uncharacterized protein n=1 Tax=Trichonephila inaurata madagascariensis TaxID=2747483 RepID=A0A8X6WS69_9ARAC|nr:hypothetical protein TNIN_53821 [Trichonephila inaurata madagascariensis]